MGNSDRTRAGPSQSASFSLASPILTGLGPSSKAVASSSDSTPGASSTRPLGVGLLCDQLSLVPGPAFGSRLHPGSCSRIRLIRTRPLLSDTTVSAPTPASASSTPASAPISTPTSASPTPASTPAPTPQSAPVPTPALAPAPILQSALVPTPASAPTPTPQLAPTPTLASASRTPASTSPTQLSTSTPASTAPTWPATACGRHVAPPLSAQDNRRATWRTYLASIVNGRPCP